MSIRTRTRTILILALSAIILGSSVGLAVALSPATPSNSPLEKLFKSLVSDTRSAESAPSIQEIEQELQQYRCLSRSDKIIRELGRGKGGVVYEISHKGERQALKVQKTTGENYIKYKFIDRMKECELAQLAARDNIGFEVYKCRKCGPPDTAENFVIMRMRYADGILSNLVRHTKYTEEEIEGIARQMVGLCLLLREKKFTHDDLHLDNIAYVGNAKKFELKIIDFGRSVQVYEENVDWNGILRDVQALYCEKDSEGAEVRWDQFRILYNKLKEIGADKGFISKYEFDPNCKKTS